MWYALDRLNDRIADWQVQDVPELNRFGMALESGISWLLELGEYKEQQMATKKVKQDAKISHTGRWTENGFQPTQKPVVKVVRVSKPKRHDDPFQQLA